MEINYPTHWDSNDEICSAEKSIIRITNELIAANTDLKGCINVDTGQLVNIACIAATIRKLDYIGSEISAVVEQIEDLDFTCVAIKLSELTTQVNGMQIDICKAIRNSGEKLQ